MDPTELLERLNKVRLKWTVCSYDTPAGRRFFLTFLPEEGYTWHYFYGDNIEEVFEQFVRSNP